MTVQRRSGDGIYASFPITSYINLPDNPLVAPDGLVTSVRGFGRVWYNHPTVRENIGYAIGEEIPHRMTWEDTGQSLRVNIPSGDTLILQSWGIWQYDRSASPPPPPPPPLPTCTEATQSTPNCIGTRLVAYQTFERGFMFYSYGSGEIMVFFNDGTATTFSSYYYGGQEPNPINTAPPAGYYRPILGFGKVWGHNAFVREKIGWATAPESTWHVPFISDLRAITYTIVLPDTRTIQLSVFRGQRWRVVDA